MTKKEWSYLFVATLLAALLRFIYLDATALWLDELTIWSVTQIHPFWEMLRQYHLEPPLYLIFQQLSTYFFTQNEFGVRFLVALIGTISVPAIYFLGRMFSVRAASLSAALLVVSYNGIYFSQEARAFALLILLSIVSTIFWFRICFQPVRRRDVALYSLSIIALFYTHYYGLLFVAAQGFWALFYFRHIGVKNFLAVIGSFILFTVPWIPLLLEHSDRKYLTLAPPRWIDILGYHRYLFDQTALLSTIGTILIFLTLSKRWQNASGRWSVKFAAIEKEVALIVFGVLPFAIAFARSRTVSPILYERCMLIALPSTMVLMASAADFVTRSYSWLSTKRSAFLGLSILLVSISAQNTFFRRNVYSADNKDRNREATRAAIELKQKYNYPMVVLAKNPKIGSYYLSQYAPEIEYGNLPQTAVEILPAELRRVAGDGNLIFFNFTVDTDPKEQLRALESEYVVVERHYFRRANYIYVLKRK